MTLNLYGDQPIAARGGYGVDIAIQRADDLDNLALAYIQELGGNGVRALDVACGAGGQAVRMAMAGAVVSASDIVDYRTVLQNACVTAQIDEFSFVVADMRTLPASVGSAFDVIICQRAIHYLSHVDALATVRGFARLLSPRGRLYLSASGLRSELGSGYPGLNDPVERRLSPLSQDMVTKHNIHGPVCLYTTDDLHDFLVVAGLRAKLLFESPFGNVKSVSAL
jgi:2-polyprenyl-3-methyl-5-hydroxy-6-metoxy-1,4-benzoquinol methylase